MLRYLNGEPNVKGGPNENYGREMMELFALGVTHAITGAKNYTENDVQQIAKALSGWHIDDRDPNNVKALFDSAPLVQRPEVDLRQARQLQHRHAPSTWCSTRTAHGAVHRQEAVGRVHAHAARRAVMQSSPTKLHRERPQAQAAAAQRSSRTRSSSSPSTSRT